MDSDALFLLQERVRVLEERLAVLEEFRIIHLLSQGGGFSEEVQRG